MQRCRDDIFLAISQLPLSRVSLFGNTFTSRSFVGPALAGPTSPRSGGCHR